MNPQQELSVVKIGGNVIDDEARLKAFLQGLARLEGRKVLVHGGGKTADQLLERMGITPKKVDGRRITDDATLQVVAMVYAGWINKNIVSSLHGYGCPAIGLCGADMNAIQAHKRHHPDIDYGWAGDIDAVDGAALKSQLEQGFTVVMAPITHDGHGQLLNTNADTIAAAVAEALSAYFQVSLFYCFEKEGVMMNPADPESVIPEIDALRYDALRENKIIADGMLPKMNAAFNALRGGVGRVWIGSDYRFVKQELDSGTFLTLV
jgi:acetylglutamate kinase